MLRIIIEIISKGKMFWSLINEILTTTVSQ